MARDLPRGKHGRLLSARCPDPNCDGVLRREREGYWRCDGLTHATDTSPLIACTEAHFDGENRERRP